MKTKAIIVGCAIGLAALVVEAAAAAETEAAREFKRLTNELRAKQGTTAAGEYFGLLERSLGEFIKRYPKSPEAGEARFALGRIYSGTGSHEKAIEQFDAYLKTPGEKSPDARAQATFALASSHLALERHDEAEKLLREVAGAGLAVDPRIVEAAENELSRVEALRRIKVGAPAANITGTSNRGKKIDLAAYRGKVVLLDFWAAWCAPCRMEMPNVIKTYNEFHKKGFEIIGVSLDEDRAQFDNFIRENKMEWPQLFDGKGWQNGAARSYAVNAIPATFLIDRTGKIRYKNLRGPMLREAVEKLIAEK